LKLKQAQRIREKQVVLLQGSLHPRSLNSQYILSITLFSMPTTWQDKLEEKCRGCGFQTPHYQDFSDRRGGRTAWSSSVAFGPHVIKSRFMYDGANINNAREDAAEVAYNSLNSGLLPQAHRASAAAAW